MKKKRINFGQVKIRFGNNIGYDKEKITMLSNEKVKKHLMIKKLKLRYLLDLKKAFLCRMKKKRLFYHHH